MSKETDCINCRYFFDEEGGKGCCYCSCGDFKCINNKTKEEVNKEFALSEKDDGGKTNEA